MKMGISILMSLCCVLQTQAMAQTCTTEQGIVQRFQMMGETLELGDELTLSIGGYTINYVVNDFSKAADQWPRYLATEINAILPPAVARFGDIHNNYLPVSSVEANYLDVLQTDLPVTFLKNGLDYSAQFPEQPLVFGVSSGSAMTTWQKGFNFNTQYGFLVLTNITDSDVSVQATFYDQNGNVYDEASEAGTQLIFLTDSADFVSPEGDVLRAKSSRYVHYRYGGGNFGLVEIKWQSDHCLDKA